MQVPEATGFFEVDHAARAGNANCVSFTTLDFVKDDGHSIAGRPVALIEAFCASFGTLGRRPADT